MNPLEAADIRGNWATLLLNIDAEQRIDVACLEDQIAYCAEHGVDGVYTNGTAGEFYAQSFDEFCAVSETVAAACNRLGTAFQLGASFPTAQESLRRVEFAARLKPGAIQVILPDWFPVDPETAVNFLARTAKAADGIGLVLYNPPHAKVRLDPQQLNDLVDKVPAIVGLKSAGGDAGWYAAMTPVLDRISVFIPGHFLASGVAQGAHGSYSNVACINPGAAQRWRRQIQSDPDGAMDLEKRIGQFMARVIQPLICDEGYPNHACDKFMAAMGGWCHIGPRLRWPYRWIGEDRIPAARVIAQELLPEFF